MGFDSLRAKDLDDAVAKFVKDWKATEHVLRRDTVSDRVFAGGAEDLRNPDFVAFHHLWMIVGDKEPQIVLLFLKEFRAGKRIECAYKPVSEANGPAAFDVPMEWVYSVPRPEPLFPGMPSWRDLVIHSRFHEAVAMRKRMSVTVKRKRKRMSVTVKRKTKP